MEKKLQKIYFMYYNFMYYNLSNHLSEEILKIKCKYDQGDRNLGN